MTPRSGGGAHVAYAACWWYARQQQRSPGGGEESRNVMRQRVTWQEGQRTTDTAQVK